MERAHSRFEQALLKCLEWSRMGRHRHVLAEVEQVLPTVRQEPELAAQLLIWKAQALLSMSFADRALIAARESWKLDETPHACHLMASSMHALGETDDPIELLRLGIKLFPDAVQLPVQLAMILTDHGRMEPALQALEEISPEHEVPEDLEVFLYGMRANLLATTGQWDEADVLLQEGLDQYPDSGVLHDTYEALSQTWLRLQTEAALIDSWIETLDTLSDTAAEVDEKIELAGELCTYSELEVLAARRLWRAYLHSRAPRVQAPEAWAAATLLAIAEIDGGQPSPTVLAQLLGAKPGTIRSARGKLRAYLESLEPQIVKRSFSAHDNPRLEQPTADKKQRYDNNVVAFPGRSKQA
jgi:tetratricopeptide (TPR) repeat protein